MVLRGQSGGSRPLAMLSKADKWNGWHRSFSHAAKEESTRGRVVESR